MAEQGRIVVEGLAGLQRAVKRIDKNAAKDLCAELKEIAEPVKATAERLAGETGNIGLTPQWQQIRIGVTQHGVYIVPKHRRGAGPKRPNFKTLMLDRAMIPAVEENRSEINAGLDRFLDGIERDWVVG